MAENIPIQIDRETRDIILNLVFGNITDDILENVDQKDLASAAAMIQIEAHLLWRIDQMIKAKMIESESVTTLREILKNCCLVNTAKNLQKDMLARPIFAKMYSEGIKVMLLKGTALRFRYPQLAGRPQCDTDVLIPRDDVERAEAILLDAGYAVRERFFTREDFLEKHFHLPIVKDNNKVELHWTMSNSSECGATERTWERAEKIDWYGTPIWVPSITDQFVFTQIHISRHLFYNSLRWFGDMLFELEKWPNLTSQLGEIRQDWPSRMVSFPLKVAANFNFPLDRQTSTALEAESRFDISLMESMVKKAFWNEEPYGLSQSQTEYIMSSWLTNTGSSMPWEMAKMFTRQLTRKSIDPWE